MIFTRGAGIAPADAATEDDKASADRDKDKDGGTAKPGHHRHNLYVLVLSPRTQVRDTRRGDARDKNGVVSSIDALEIGERLDSSYSTLSRNSSRSRLLNDSIYPFSQGLAAVTGSDFAPTPGSQSANAIKEGRRRRPK